MVYCIELFLSLIRYTSVQKSSSVKYANACLLLFLGVCTNCLLHNMYPYMHRQHNQAGRISVPWIISSIKVTVD